MKIEHLLVQHIYAAKQLTLQGIGTIRLNPAVSLPSDTDKDFVMPENAFEFEYDPKSTEDEALIDFIIKKTGKIRPLAISDLDSYVMLSKQFLNIGKPLLIEGVGTIQKNQAGSYEFLAGHFVAPRVEDAHKPMKEKKADAVSFESESKNTNSSRNKLIIALLLLLITLIGWAIYHFAIRDTNTPEETQVQNTIPVADTTIKDTVAIVKPDSSLLAPVVTPTDSSLFKIVIKEYSNKAIAEQKFKNLKVTKFGDKLELIAIDSVRYKIAAVFNSNLSDTAIMRDSIKLWYGGKPYIELKK